MLVSGRVQGVCFRAATQQQAKKLSLKGFVRNLPDERVEIIAEGPDADLQKLQDWSHKGPIMARVENVITEEIPITEPFSDFKVKYTFRV
jgi:acylphosphatase